MATKRDRAGFIKSAREQGYSDSEINAYLQQKGDKPIGFLENLLSGSAIPTVGGILGGGAGTIIAPGPGTGFGAAVGAGGGYALRNSLRDLLGYQTDKPEQQLGESATGVASAGITGGLLGELLNVGNFLFRPGQLRTQKIANLPQERQNLSAVDVGKAMEAPQSTYATPDMVKTSQTLKSNLYQKLFPTIGTTETGIAPAESINKNDLYKQLNEFQKELKAYESTSTQSRAGADISSSVRKLINQTTPEVKNLNKYMSSVAKISPYASRWLPRLGLGYLVYRAIPSIWKSIQNQ